MHHVISTETRMPKGQAAALASAALAVPALLSAGIGPDAHRPGIHSWYARLRKPAFNPPKRVFPLVWSTLQSLLAYSAYRVARTPASSHRRAALWLWGIDVAAIGAWPRLFFGAHAVASSAALSAGLAAAGTAYVVEAARVDRRAAVAAVPFVGWVAFATVLSTSIWLLNTRPLNTKR